MPSRMVTAFILFFWLFCAGWFVQREYLPRWLASDNSPEFLVELADETAPRHTAWTIQRGDKRVGFLSTKMTYMPKEDAFELESKLQSVDFEIETPLFKQKINARAKSIISTSVMSRDGRLKTLHTLAEFEIGLEPIQPGKKSDAGFSFKAELHGRVTNNLFEGESRLSAGFEEWKSTLEPFETTRGSLFNPLQPQDRLLGLKPGQSWKVEVIDPVEDTLMKAASQTIAGLAKKEGIGTLDTSKLFATGAKEYIARVLDEPENLESRKGPERCYVIEYRNSNLAAKTWVRVSDGKVLQQEARGMGERLLLIRDN